MGVGQEKREESRGYLVRDGVPPDGGLRLGHGVTMRDRSWNRLRRIALPLSNFPNQPVSRFV